LKREIIDEEFDRLYAEKSDINEHLPTLKMYAEKCEHITEMGFRTGVSCVALLAGRPKKMISYDILDNWMGIRHQDRVKTQVPAGTDWDFIVADTRTLIMEETDFLFIDTLHDFEQLKIELARHAGRVRKYIGFHDIVSFGRRGESGGNKGLMDAIEEFLYPSKSSFDSMISPSSGSKNKNPDWEVAEQFLNCNGLLILRRINESAN
jgi:hypothetical protein